MKTKKINQLGMENEVNPFETRSQHQTQLQSQEFDVHQKCVELSPENPLMKCVSAMKSGNKQYQTHILLYHYRETNHHRSRMGIRLLSRSRYLEIVRHSLKQTGLLSDRDLRSIGLDMLPHNLCATS